MNRRSKAWRYRLFAISGGVFLCGLAWAANEKLPTWTVGDEAYTNVIVTSVTATDIYFTHSRGVGNAKLRQLSPELQERFHYDPARAAQKESQQSTENALYNQAARETKPSPRPHNSQRTASTPSPTATPPGRHGPEIFVEKWITPQPDTNGKFVLLDFWATWCRPCRASIPKLNALHNQFNDRVVIIGLSSENEQAVRRLGVPPISYAVAIDTQARTERAARVSSIPHVLLIDPKGIVRFEGHPGGLDAKKLEDLIAKYGG